MLRAERSVVGLDCDGSSLGTAGDGSGCCHDLLFHKTYVLYCLECNLPSKMKLMHFISNFI